MRIVPVLLSFAAIAAAAPSRDKPLDPRTQAALDKALAGRVPGTPTSCVPIGRSQLSTKAYGPTLLYTQANGDIYRNDTGGGCENAARGDILVSVEYEGRPCSGDIIRTVDPYARTTTGSCGLRNFVPYSKPKAVGQ